MPTIADKCFERTIKWLNLKADIFEYVPSFTSGLKMSVCKNRAKTAEKLFDNTWMCCTRKNHPTTCSELVRDKKSWTILLIQRYSKVISRIVLLIIMIQISQIMTMVTGPVRRPNTQNSSSGRMESFSILLVSLESLGTSYRWLYFRGHKWEVQLITFSLVSHVVILF